LQRVPHLPFFYSFVEDGTDVGQDITNITDQRIFNAFRVKDQQAGYWLTDDPSLSALQSFIRSGH